MYPGSLAVFLYNKEDGIFRLFFLVYFGIVRKIGVKGEVHDGVSFWEILATYIVTKSYKRRVIETMGGTMIVTRVGPTIT